MGEESTFKPRPDKDNPKGYFENFDFRKVNDQILERAGYVVKEWNLSIPTLQADFFQKRKMKRLISGYADKYEKWGWKDPRQMLTNDLWHDVFRELNADNRIRYIFVYRHPLSVAISMMKRGNIETISHGLALWHFYNQCALDFIVQNNNPCIFLSYENFFEDSARSLIRLANFLEVPITRDLVDSFISPSLIHSDYKVQNSDNKPIQDTKVIGLYGTLQSYAK